MKKVILFALLLTSISLSAQDGPVNDGTSRSFWNRPVQVNVNNIRPIPTATNQVLISAYNTRGALRYGSTDLATAVSATTSFGELFVGAADPDTLNITAGTPDSIADATAGQLQLFTADGSTLTYTGTVAVTVQVKYSASTTTDGTNHLVYAWIFQNGAKVLKSEATKKIGTGTDVDNFGSGCILTLQPGDTISLGFDSGASVELIIYNANIQVAAI